MTRLRNRLLYIVLVVSFLVVAAAIRFFDPFFVHALRLVAFDHYQQFDPGDYDPSLPVRVIDIDERIAGENWSVALASNHHCQAFADPDGRRRRCGRLRCVVCRAR